MAKTSTFEKAIGKLNTGYTTRYFRNKHTYSCHAIAEAEGRGLGISPQGPMEAYARSWFANKFEASGDYLDYNHYSGVFSGDPAKRRRDRIQQQYTRALWLTLLDLLYETGESPL